MQFFICIYLYDTCIISDSKKCNYFYLLERQRDTHTRAHTRWWGVKRERWRSVLHLLVHASFVFNSQVWNSPKPGAQSFNQVLHLSGRDQVLTPPLLQGELQQKAGMEP